MTKAQTQKLHALLAKAQAQLLDPSPRAKPAALLDKALALVEKAQAK